MKDIFAAVSGLLLFVGSSQAATIKVTKLTDDGSSGTLRKAINSAKEGDTISIEVNGVISLQPSGCPNPPCGADSDADGFADLDIDKTMTITGPGSDKLIIDGNGAKTNDRVFTVNNNNDGTGLLLQGVSVRNGNTASQGGGIYVSYNGWLTVRDSEIVGNKAASDGGGIYVADEVGLVVDNSTVDQNTTNSSGGGLYAYSYDTVSITNSTFSKNHADSGYGGGVYTYENANEITNSTFSDNTSDYGGGIYDYYGALTASNSEITKNKATYYGGGFGNEESSDLFVDSTVSKNVTTEDDYDGGGLYMYEGNLTVLNTTVDSNESSNGGGGIYTYEGGLNIMNSTISNNVANRDGGTSYSSGGGGIYMYDDYSDTVVNSVISGNVANSDSDSPGGGVMDYDSYGAVFDNVSFLNNASLAGTGSNNSTAGGGGLYTYNYSTNINNSLFSGNSTTGDDGSYDNSGGGVYIDDYNFVATNTTFTGNSASGNGGGIYSSSYGTLLSNVTMTDNTSDSNKGGITGGDGGGIYNDYYTVTIKNSIVQGNHDASAAHDAPDCYNDFTNNDYMFVVQGANILGSQKGCEIFGDMANLSNKDPMFADALADNDGLKQGANLKSVNQTLALTDGSPALAKGVDGCQKTDARGVERPNALCDLGAFQLSKVVPADTSGCAASGSALLLLMSLAGLGLALHRRRMNASRRSY